ncbi:MAG: hypothetical protein H6719_30040 [Sandaracinaceae bacterium]|nr:hypothetical protein [Sandaracinaceae bacterium]
MALLPLLALAAPLAAGVMAFLSRTEDPDDARLGALEHTPLKTIAAVKPGEIVKVRGRIEPLGGALDAPYSARPSVLYELVGVVRAGDGTELRRVPLASGQTAFWVVDDTSRLLVREGPLARLILSEQVGAGGPHIDRLDIESRYAAELGGRELEWAALASLDVGEPVIVHGRVALDPTVRGKESAGYRDHLGVPALVVDPSVERLVTDRPELVG